MLLHLIKKDILIAKTHIFIILIIIGAMPLFYTFTAPDISSFFPFLYMVIIGEVVLLQSISQLEAKNPKAVALLCTTPYVRNTIVKAKYTFFILIFAYCYIAHTVLTLAMNPTKTLDLTATMAVLLFSAILYGIYMPIEFKYGVVKAKLIFMTTIFVFSLGPMILKFFSKLITIDFSMLMAIPFIIKNVLLLAMSIAVFIISMMVSIKIFTKKEL